MLDLYDFRKEDARKKVILFPLGKIGLIEMEHVEFSKDSEDLLKYAYEKGPIPAPANYYAVQPLIRLNLLDGGDFNITPLGTLFFEQTYLDDSNRWYCNSMLDYLDYFKMMNNDMHNRKKVSEICDKDHSAENCIKMAIFLHRFGFIKIFGMRRETDPYGDYMVEEIYERVDELLYQYHAMKEIEYILQKVPDQKEQDAIFGRYKLASILSGNKYYFEAVTMLGSIVEHLMFLASRNYPEYHDTDEFKHLFKFFSSKPNSVGNNMKSLAQNGHLIKMREETVALMDYRNSIHISNKVNKGDLKPEAYKDKVGNFNQLCRQFAPS